MKGLMMGLAILAAASTFFGSSLFSRLAGVNEVGPNSFMGVIPVHGERTADIYRDGERKSRDAEIIHHRCSGAVAERIDKEAGYLACFINVMVEEPKLLCDKEAKGRLIRYSRAYFYVASLAMVLSKRADVQHAMRMQRMMQDGGDVEAGPLKASFDPEVLDGLEALARKGALSVWEFGGFFSPHAPTNVSERLLKIKAEGMACK